MEKTLLSFAFSALALGAAAATVTSVTMTPDASSGEVTVSYVLSESATFVPTLSLEADGPSGWEPMDDRVVSRATGDVNRKITGSGGTIRFIPEGDLAADLANVRARVTIWEMDDTPDYMVFSLAPGAASAEGRVTYYASTNAMPGGLLGNKEYRATYMVFRKIKAKGVTWKMGANNSVEGVSYPYRGSEAQHEVTLDRNYYIGVFPLTHAQYNILMGAINKQWFKLEVDLRTRDAIFFSIYQCARGAALWPDPPSSGSVLGNMRALSANAIDFDLPTEAEWEFACRAGYGDNTFGDGSAMSMRYTAAIADRETDAALDRLGRYKGNNATQWFSKWQDGRDYAQYQGVTNGIPVAGSYAPNAWGLYVMLGGVWEWCLDWYQDDITTLNGAVNIDPTDGSKCADGVTTGGSRVIRGGAWHTWAYECRPARRASSTPGYRGDWISTGLRAKCYMGLR